VGEQITLRYDHIALDHLRDAVIEEHGIDYGLTRLDFKGQSLYVPLQSLDVGAPLRIYNLSSDISLVLTPASAALTTSALSILEATVVEIREIDQATVDVQLDIGSPLVASITKKSLTTLKLAPGQRVCAHLESVALIEALTE